MEERISNFISVNESFDLEMDGGARFIHHQVLFKSEVVLMG